MKGRPRLGVGIDRTSERGRRGPAAADGGGKLIDLDGDCRLRRAEVGNLLGGGVRRGGRGDGDGALYRAGAVEDVDFIALALLVERHVRTVGPDAAETRAAHPRDGEVPGRIARAPHVHWRPRDEADRPGGED